MAPFMFSGLRQPIVIVVDVTSNTVKLSGLLGTVRQIDPLKTEYKIIFNIIIHIWVYYYSIQLKLLLLIALRLFQIWKDVSWVHDKHVYAFPTLPYPAPPFPSRTELHQILKIMEISTQ